METTTTQKLDRCRNMFRFLRRVARGMRHYSWMLCSDGSIRTEQPDCLCPLAAAANVLTDSRYGNGQYGKAADALGWRQCSPAISVIAIAEAADSRGRYRTDAVQNQVRRILLRAAKLVEARPARDG